jgi:hypothetical protein
MITVFKTKFTPQTRTVHTAPRVQGATAYPGGGATTT